jgi:translation initiation factor 1 (eIF-1/SUI1)
MEGSTERRRKCKVVPVAGTVKGSVIDVQSDHRESVAAEMRSLGFEVKLAGG